LRTILIIAGRSYFWPSICNPRSGKRSRCRAASRKSSTKKSWPRKSASA